jgi:molybdenum cofactor biosynthesis enzyme MoaA
MVNMDNIKSIETNISWPTKQINDLRHKMVNVDVEKNTPECRWCWTSENSGIESLRQKTNKFWFDRLGESGVQNLIENPNLNVLDLQFGHLCNLSCVMCNASLSSHMHSTKLKLIETTNDSVQKEKYKRSVDYLKDNLDWTLDPSSYEKVLELCKPITEIKISGGEPMFNPKFKHFLRYLVEKEVPLYRLNLTTNATVCDDEIIELINRIPHVTIKISMESIAREDEFIRWPTQWKTKDLVIKKLLSGINKNEYLQFIISSCIQSLNLFSFDKITNYVEALNDHRIIIQQQSVLPADTASLWHADVDYITEYLNTINKEKHHKINNYALDTLSFKEKRTKEQVLYFTDMARIQGKNLKDEFPIYWKHHEKYLQYDN